SIKSQFRWYMGMHAHRHHVQGTGMNQMLRRFGYQVTRGGHPADLVQCLQNQHLLAFQAQVAASRKAIGATADDDHIKIRSARILVLVHQLIPSRSSTTAARGGYGGKDQPRRTAQGAPGKGYMPVRPICANSARIATREGVWLLKPPSATSVVPVTKEDSSLARNATTSAICRGVPSSAVQWLSRRMSSKGSGMACSEGARPICTALPRMPCL